MTTEREYLNSAEVAKMLELKPQSLRKWRLIGRGPRYLRAGDSLKARVLYRRADLDAWQAKRIFASTAEEHANCPGEKEG